MKFYKNFKFPTLSIGQNGSSSHKIVFLTKKQSNMIPKSCGYSQQSEDKMFKQNLDNRKVIYVLSNQGKMDKAGEIAGELYNKNQQLFNQIAIYGQSSHFARQLANTRANIATPKYIFQLAKQISQQTNSELKYLIGKQLQQKGLNLMYNVGKASQNQSYLLNLTYKGNNQSNEYVSIVGKGVCFDSGGLSIKPSTGMSTMYLDKHGACSALAAFRAITMLKPKMNLTCSLGMVQNSVSGNSYRPSDIIKSYKGLQVQVDNTDAEGRLVLADVMTWTQKNYNIKKMIQLSTLTGSIKICLGSTCAGLFSNSDLLSENIIKCGNQVGQMHYRLPILPQHQQLMNGKFADLVNVSGKNDGASSQAAAFLKKFVQKDVEWAHIDIAAVAGDKQATGFGAQTLIQFIKTNC